MAIAISLLYAFSTGFRRMIFMLLLFWLLLSVRVGAKNQSSEIQTLLQFKRMTDVDSDGVSRGYWSTWNETDEHPCEWWGVTCTASFTVVRLDLSGWGLTHLPSLGVLSSLTDLRELDLSTNNFKTPRKIPDDVTSLVGLTLLNLSGQESSWTSSPLTQPGTPPGFYGPLPQNISACRSLQYLSLEYNYLTGEIPDLSGLVNLQFLYLGWNLFSGNFPEWLGQTNSILAVELTNNMFNGTIPSLSNLTNLLELMLDNNNFTGFQEPVFPGAVRLVQLTVTGNLLQGPIPPSLANFPNLKNLDLSNNQLSGPIPSGFSLNMSESIGISFGQNQLTGSIPESLLQPTTYSINLPTLNFSNNQLTGHIPFHANKNYNYYKIDFSNNNLNGTIPPICNNGSSYFYQLSLQNNNLFGDIVDFIIDCYENVTELHLANNSLCGDLSRLANTSVDFSKRNSTTLQDNILDLSNNNLQMSTLGGANRDSLGAALEYFLRNMSIIELHMQGNNFSGASLPRSLLSAAEYLLVLDLSNNHLIGEISVATFNSTEWPALHSLNLSNNDIKGTVPEAIVMIPNLVALDLSNNGLSGPLPALPDTLYIPSFFAGNRGLCGGPKLHSCSRGVQWWLILLVAGAAMLPVLGSCGVVTWRFRVYHRLHQQDTDLIKALREKESASLMSLRELSKATDNFADSARIGAGGFGTVYIGKLNDGSRVAIKRSKREGSENDKNRFLNEVTILSQVNHRHLVKLLGCCMENKIALLVFEFVSNGTLEEHLRRKIGVVRLSWKQRLRIAVQTADALNYLHSAATFPIYHRDVKPANILLDDKLNAKVADFGIAKLAPCEATHVSTMAVQGTLGYLDPDYFTTFQFSDKSDVYSFGVVLLELISAKAAIDFQRDREQTGLVSFARAHILKGDLRPIIDVALMDTYDNVAGHGKESILNVGRLAVKCVQTHSKARPTMNEVWKDLEKMWRDLAGTSKDFVESIDIDDGNKDPRSDEMALLYDSFHRNGSISSVRADNDATSMQMTPFSHRLKKSNSSLY